MRRLFTTINAIRLLSTVIMGIAAYVSYGTQRQVLLSWDVESDAAALIPITIDVLAIIANLAIHAPGVDRSGRRVAMTVLVFAGTVSMAANAFAGTTWGSRIAHVWCVAAYLLAEWVAAKVKAAKVTEVTRAGNVPAPIAHRPCATDDLPAPDSRQDLTPTAPEIQQAPVELHPVAAVLALPANAPVSPAPAALEISNGPARSVRNSGSSPRQPHRRAAISPLTGRPLAGMQRAA